MKFIVQITVILLFGMLCVEPGISSGRRKVPRLFS